MFSFDTLYENYVTRRPEELERWIEDILEKKNLSSVCGDTLRRCFDVTKEYTNNHQKKADLADFENGEYLRKSKEPYINHTLRVALILLHEELYTNINVIYAAIMHDLFEDTTYTYEQAANEFGLETADLILSVTNVARDQDDKERADFSQETLDYSSIIERCSAHRLAFYIKFADRLDNLRTLGAMPEHKQKKKIADTKKYLLPLMTAIGAQRFKSFVWDAIFKIEESFQGKNKYDIVSKQLIGLKAYKSTELAVNTLKDSLCGDKRKYVDLRITYPSVYEVYNQVSSRGIDYKRFTQSDITYDLHLIIRSALPKTSLVEFVSEFISNSDLSEITIERIGKEHLYFYDSFFNHYKMKIVTQREYNLSQYGNINRDIPITDAYNIDDDITDDNKITVYTPGRKAIYLKEGSTVIDFAFKLSEDHGIKMAGAIVNGAEADVFTVLRKGDVVEILLIEDNNSLVQVNWILHCETNNARFKICRHLQSKIDQLIARIDRLQ